MARWPSASFAADAIYGVWARDGHPTDKLEFYDCSGKLCAKGTIPEVDGSPAPKLLGVLSLRQLLVAEAEERVEVGNTAT